MIVEKLEKNFRAPFEVPKKYNKNAVILASFPKSGNTWLRFVFSNILAEHSKLEIEVNFDNIRQYAPEIRGNRALNNAVFSSACPTFLKTHFYNVNGFAKYQTLVLFREPKKSLISYYKYMVGEHGKNYASFSDFLNKPRVGIDYWNLFHQSWLDSSNAIFVSYDDLIKNQKNGLKSIYLALGYDIKNEIIQSSIVASSRENMARVEARYGDPNKKNLDFKFVSNTENRYAELFMGNDELKQKVHQLIPTYKKMQQRKLKLKGAN